MTRLVRVTILSGVAGFVAVGTVVSYRAYSPVSSVTIVLPEPTIRVGGGIRVDTVSSGRGPVSIEVDLIQGSHRATAVIDRVSARPWTFWDFRSVRHSTYVLVHAALLERFSSGPAVVRTTAIGAPAWLRQPPPVVEEASVELRVEPAGTH